MIETEEIEIKNKEIRTKRAFCDFCGKEFDERTTMCNGFGQINIGFGFGSSFDDDNFHLEICDKCFINIFSKKLMSQFKEKEYNIDKIYEGNNTNNTK